MRVVIAVKKRRRPNSGGGAQSAERRAVVYTQVVILFWATISNRSFGIYSLSFNKKLTISTGVSHTMLDFELLSDEGILRVSPASPILVRDFVQLTEVVDRYLTTHERLNGIIISADALPGWEDFAAQVSLLQFLRDHHRHIPKIAALANAPLINVLPPIAAHFEAAVIREFGCDQLQAASDWIQAKSNG